MGAARKATSHLIDASCKNIALLTYQSGLAHLKDRKKGYVAALKDAGIEFKKALVKEVDIANDSREISKALNDLFENDQPDGLLIASNILAAHGLKYINTLPLKVPADLAVVSFDETEALDLFYAPLTYIRQPLQEMGKKATQILLENITAKNKITQVVMEGELIVRASSKR
jgi:LacI family transcriptional regulator